MSLLSPNQTFGPLPKEQQLSNTVANIKQTIKQSFRQLLDIQHRGIRVVWENNNLTPQEIIDAMGDDAVKVFQYHGLLTDLIKQLAILDNVTPDIKLPTNEFTVTNSKITVGEGPYTSN